MATTLERATNAAVVLRLRPALELDDGQLYALAQLNRELRIERTADGEIEIMPPTGGETSSRNAILTALVTSWALREGSGKAYDSSGGFVLPNGATRSPDVSWVRRERLDPLTPEQRDRFLPLCPDFVVELRSPSDCLEPLGRKMEEYIANGARLGWLLDVPNRTAHVYRPGADVEVVRGDAQLSGERVLRGFELDVRRVWEG